MDADIRSVSAVAQGQKIDAAVSERIAAAKKQQQPLPSPHVCYQLIDVRML